MAWSYRPRILCAVSLTVATLALATGVALAVVVPAGLGDRIGFGCLGVVVAGLLWPFIRLRLAGDQDGLTVVNPLRTRRLDWAEILAVSLPPGASWPTIDLADGTALAVLPLQISDGPRYAAVLDRIERLAWGHGASEPG